MVRRAGGWEKAGAADLFVRYSERAARHLGDLIGAATTFNEPNIPVLLQWMFARMPQNPFAGVGAISQQAAKLVGSERFSAFMTGDPEKERDMMVPTHHKAMAAMKAGPGKYPVGVNLAMSDDQALPGAEAARDKKRAALYGAWLEAAGKSDFVGVQTTPGRG